jgi:uncharacterized protein (DUF3820 family)
VSPAPVVIQALRAYNGCMRTAEHRKHLIELANYRMPFGKYKGTHLVDLPDEYLLWFRQKGFPAGKLGRLMEEALEIRTHGLENMLRKLRDNPPP